MGVNCQEIIVLSIVTIAATLIVFVGAALIARLVDWILFE
jgi:hypothetical protein